MISTLPRSRSKPFRTALGSDSISLVMLSSRRNRVVCPRDLSILLMAVVGYPQVTAMFLRAARFGLTGQLSAFWAFRHGSSAQCEGDAFRPKISLSILLKLLLQVFNPTIFVLPDLLWKVCFLLHSAAGVRIGAEPIPGRVHIQSGRTHLIAGQLCGGRYREHWRNHQIAGCLVVAW